MPDHRFFRYLSFSYIFVCSMAPHPVFNSYMKFISNVIAFDGTVGFTFYCNGGHFCFFFLSCELGGFMGVMGVMEEQNWRNPAPVEILKSHVKHLCIYIYHNIYIYIYMHTYIPTRSNKRKAWKASFLLCELLPFFPPRLNVTTNVHLVRLIFFYTAPHPGTSAGEVPKKARATCGRSMEHPRVPVFLLHYKHCWLENGP